MSTLLEITQDVRDLWLDSPMPQRPSIHRTLRAVLVEAQNIYNHLSNTAKPWAVREVQLQVGPVSNFDGQDFILPAASDFGKVMSVVTRDDVNPSHIERSIDFFEAHNLDFEWDRPNNAGFAAWWGSPHSGERVAFVRKDGSIYARFKPWPQLPATYMVMYSIGDWASSAALDSSPILSEHHHLIAVRSAGILLSDAEWSSDGSANAAKRQEIANLKLMPAEERYGGEFEKYAASIKTGRLRFRHSAIPFD